MAPFYQNINVDIRKCSFFLELLETFLSAVYLTENTLVSVDPFDVFLSGVPQGSILDPLLFAIKFKLMICKDLKHKIQ